MMCEFGSQHPLPSPGGCLCLWCPCCGWQTKTLHLQGEEVFYKTKTARGDGGRHGVEYDVYG